MLVPIAVPLALAAATPVRPLPSSLPTDTTTAVYEVAGLRVIHRTNPGSAVIAVRVYLLGGTRQLTAATAGIEALLLRAAELETRRAMARTGSRSILDVHADWTVTGFVGLKGDLDSAWAVLAQRLVDAPLEEPTVNRARDELLSKARRRYSHPDLRIHSIAQRSLYAGHPYGLDPNGTVESLGSLDNAELAQYAEDQFITSRMLLVVVGDVPRARIESLVASSMGRLPRGAYRWTLPPPVVPPDTYRWLVEHRELPTNYILGYFAGPPPTDRDYFTFEIATALLSSRLHYAVRERRSLSYAAFAPFLDRAIPAGGIYASTSEPAEVFDLMLEEMGSLRFVQLHHRVWSRFLDQFTLGHLTQMMTSDGQAEALARAYLYFDDYREADEYLRRLRKVKPNTIARVVDKYMQHIQYAYLGDTTRMRGRW
jgi:zinc protease